MSRLKGKSWAKALVVAGALGCVPGSGSDAVAPLPAANVSNRQVIQADGSVPDVARAVIRSLESIVLGTAAGAAGGQRVKPGSEVGGKNPRYPHEPAEFVPWFEHDWQTWPNKVNERMFASGTGMIVASHYERDAGDDFILIDDPDAPHGTGKSLRHRQREGQRTGTTSGIFNLFNPKTDAGESTSAKDQVRLRSVYRSHWVYFEPDPRTRDWQFGNTHMRTFWGNRHYGTSQMNVSLRAPQRALAQRYGHYAGANMWHSTPTTIYRSGRLELPIGQWRHHEYLWEPVGEYDVINGMTSRIRAWIDGELVIDRTITHTITAPFANDHFAMVWLGGSGNVRKQHDYVRFGDIYISGTPYEN